MDLQRRYQQQGYLADASFRGDPSLNNSVVPLNRAGSHSMRTDLNFATSAPSECPQLALKIALTISFKDLGNDVSN
jgi:hypothetical protein